MSKQLEQYRNMPLNQVLNVNQIDQICNSNSFVFAAAGWQDLLEQGFAQKRGGYSFDSRAPAITVQDEFCKTTLAVLVYNIMLNSENNTFIWVEFIYVKKEARRCKIAKRMYQQLFEIADTEGAKYIEMGTQTDNTKMLKSAAHNGFVQSSITLRKDLL